MIFLQDVKTLVFTEILTVVDRIVVEDKLNQVSDRIQGLWDELMTLEMRLVSQLNISC